MTTCPNCHNEVPDAPYCVRCGEPLANRESPYPHEGRGYAADPSQRWYAPFVVSSIFPHLPRADMHAFRAALAVGGAVIVGLCAFDLFPIALVLAAVLVPLLSLIYLVHVDIYENEPLPVLAATVAWGAVAGVALGYASSRLASDVSPLRSGTPTHDVVWLGIVLPVLGTALMLLGPLVLLPYRKFNDVLDGVTFGVGAAVTTLAAEAVTNSADLFKVGLTAPGDQSLWIARLLTLGIALPVTGAGVIGAACGILWLRYRSPAKDRASFGPLGYPPVAIVLAAAALVAAHLFVIYLDQWEALGATVVLAAVAMVALRRVIDLGLREESGEIAIGPPIRCPNCGRETPKHTFCAHCGVALRALPKPREVGASPQPVPARLPKFVLPAAFVLLIAATIGISVAAIEIVKPGPVQPPCTVDISCSHLIAGAASASPPLTRGKPWTSAVHAGLRYDASDWKLLGKSDTAVALASTFDDVTVVVLAVPSTQTPQQLLDAVRSNPPDNFNGLEVDKTEGHEILEPEIGFVAGLSGMYKATSNDATSPGRVTLEFAFEAATLGGATVLVEAITSQVPQKRGKAPAPFPPFGDVDALMDSFFWGAPSV